MSFATKLNMSKLWLFWGKIVKFCAQIVRNWELFLVYIFVYVLAQMLATWYLANSQNILVMPQSWIYPSLFSIFGQNSQILSKCHEKLEAKEKYRGVFEIQKSGDKTSSGEIGLDIRTHASPKVGQDQVSGGVSVLCWHAAPNILVLIFCWIK